MDKWVLVEFSVIKQVLLTSVSRTPFALHDHFNFICIG